MSKTIKCPVCEFSVTITDQASYDEAVFNSWAHTKFVHALPAADGGGKDGN